MPKSFKCPTCAAPLEFEGKTIQDCRYCNGKIIVPAEMFENSDFQQKQKILAQKV
jgi:DNA-directed RNA polymerase subunit RPC12/RpoP